MKGIFGYLADEGSAYDENSLLGLGDTFHRWTEGTSRHWRGTSAGLGEVPLPGPGSSAPFVTGEPGNRLVLVADARIDNLLELRNALRVKGGSLDDQRQVLLAAYRQWGENMPSHLLGDFVFAIWDESRARLFMARDHIGVKCLYYANLPGTFLFANHIAPLADSRQVPQKFDTCQVATYLKQGCCYSEDTTFFESIKRLPPATCLVYSQGRLECSRYWLPDEAPLLKLPSETEYVGRLQELLAVSVEARANSDFPVFCHLSGGLDSSTISTLAARRHKQSGRKIHAYNWNASVKSESVKNVEWSLADELAHREGIEQHSIELESEALAQVFAELDIACDDTVDLWYEHVARQHIRDIDGRVILSGWGGDELVSAYGVGRLEELIRSGNLPAAYRFLVHQGNGGVAALFKLLRRGVSILRRMAIPGRWSSNQALKTPNSSREAEYISLPDNADESGRNVNDGELDKTSVRSYQLSMLANGHIQERLQAWYSSGLEAGIEYRFPLLDKRLVEFALSIPSELYVKDGVSRYIFREAIRNLVPEVVVENYSKEEPLRVAHFHEVVLASLKEAIRFSPMENCPWVDSGELVRQVKNTHLSPDESLDLTIRKISRPLGAYLACQMYSRRHAMAECARSD